MKRGFARHGFWPPANWCTLSRMDTHESAPQPLTPAEMEALGRGTPLTDVARWHAEGRVGGRPIEKVRYTHADMIDFIIANPWVSQNELAARYGYSPSWVSTVMASDAWQSAMAARREEVVNPEMKATLTERFRAVTIQSLDRIKSELAKANCKPEVALRAAELGAKALGIGGNAPPAPPQSDSLANLASRLLELQSNVRQGVEHAQVDQLRVIEGERVQGSEGG